MTDLRKAAEKVIEAWGWDLSEPRNKMLRERMETLCQALAQPEQKPLVWMNKYGHVASFQNEEYKDPLYTAPPPKREWVGLTDAEVAQVADSEWEEAFVKLIEAKLKEKNNG